MMHVLELKAHQKRKCRAKKHKAVDCRGCLFAVSNAMVLEKKALVTITQTTLNGKEILCTGPYS